MHCEKHIATLNSALMTQAGYYRMLEHGQHLNKKVIQRKLLKNSFEPKSIGH